MSDENLESKLTVEWKQEEQNKINKRNSRNNSTSTGDRSDDIENGSDGDNDDDDDIKYQLNYIKEVDKYKRELELYNSEVNGVEVWGDVNLDERLDVIEVHLLLFVDVIVISVLNVRKYIY